MIRIFLQIIYFQIHWTKYGDIGFEILIGKWKKNSYDSALERQSNIRNDKQRRIILGLLSRVVCDMK